MKSCKSIQPKALKKNKENVPGRYYITDNCINCQYCSELAPDNIKSNDFEGYNYICKQPETSQEHELLGEAMKTCPVNAIIDSGE